ncbi:MAG: DUF4159 domain-containing protein [Verrucomicrobiales bacterium]|nr:DUF4159 domain-containing protein [Verrucomicrobiales bacterium]
MKRQATLVAVLVALLGLTIFAQPWGGRGWGRRGGRSSRLEYARTAREIPSGSTGTPVWTNAPGFEKDVFTFARVRYRSAGFQSRGGWDTDVPDSDLNLSFRLQQMTSMKVDPDGRILNLTDDDLADFPFIYIVEPGGLWLDDPEVTALRNYLLNGGFLMLDDFWGELQWANCERVMRQVFPDREFVELPLDHPLYRCVFDIREKGQVPNVGLGVSSQRDGVTWELPDAREVHHRAIFDDQGRLMVLATHNTDNGDGWEREGENHYFFEHFSEKTAYPLGINILFYVMTH